MGTCVCLTGVFDLITVCHRLAIHATSVAPPALLFSAASISPFSDEFSRVLTNSSITTFFFPTGVCHRPLPPAPGSGKRQSIEWHTALKENGGGHEPPTYAVKDEHLATTLKFHALDYYLSSTCGAKGTLRCYASRFWGIGRERRRALSLVTVATRAKRRSTFCYVVCKSSFCVQVQLASIEKGLLKNSGYVFFHRSVESFGLGIAVSKMFIAIFVLFLRGS